MSDTLWVDADALLVDYLREEIGEASDYQTLTIIDDRIFPAIVRSPADWKDWQLPTIVVMGKQTLRDPGPHGDGKAHYDKKYPYLILILTEGDQVTSVRDVKILEQRVEDALRKAVISLYSEEHESLTLVEVGDSQINPYRKPNSKDPAKSWWALAAVEIRLESTI